MLGILVAILISWILLFLIARKHFTILGITPSKKRLKEFGLGFILMALFCIINQLGQDYFKGIGYSQNSKYGFIEALNGTWWTFKAALFEEIIFRGAILYLLIKKIGLIKGCIISAIAFGIYHWFSYGLIDSGRIIPMIYVFLLTGAGGWMFAYAFAKTKSLYAPLGLHFGWILMSIVIFSAGPLGEQLFIPTEKNTELNGWLQLVFFSLQTLLIPGMVTWYLKKKYSRNN